MAKAAKKASGKPDAKSNSPFTKDQDLKAYEDMLLIRRFEEKAGQLYGMGHIGGFCHLYIGQEAVVVGMEMAMKEGDQVITSYRDHGHMLARHGPEGRDGRTDRAPGRLFQGQGRLDAHVFA
jgi:pyruvate dehydrogenase E1 component alpha subunit